VFAELVPQLLPAVTLIFPFCPAVPVVTIIEVDPCPPVIVQPEGADHVYVVAPATADILYVCPVRVGHCAVTPDIVPGCEGMPGCTVTPRVLAVLVPQLFPAVTLISPFCPAVPVVTDIEVDPCPPVIDQPEGTFHVYVVAPATTEMLYVCPVSPGHCEAVPVIVPGCKGVPGNTVTVSVFEVLVPQPFPAATLMLPFCPAEPVVTVIEVVPCPPVMDQPVGTIQTYVLALGTALILYFSPVKPGH
jgi:hypothetical protein